MERPQFRSQDKHPDWSRATMEESGPASPTTSRPWSPSARCGTRSNTIQASILGQDVKAAAERAAAEMTKIMEKTE